MIFHTYAYIAVVNSPLPKYVMWLILIQTGEKKMLPLDGMG